MSPAASSSGDQPPLPPLSPPTPSPLGPTDPRSPADAFPTAIAGSRRNLPASLQRDLSRHARREPGFGTFWRSMAVLGAVGWPIALLAVGGAFLGRWLDLQLRSGIRCTLMLITVGAALGCWQAWRTVGRLR